MHSQHPARPRLHLPPLWAIVAVQAVLHRVLLPVGGITGDTRVLQRWAATLYKHPASEFYARQSHADHLPGDLWILRLEAFVYHAVTGLVPTDSNSFVYALKLGAGLADIGIAVTLYLIARVIGGEAAGRRAALFFALNPAPLLISMVWGVADSVSMLFAALALLLAVRGWIWASLPVLAYTCLIKPQLGLLGPLLLIFFLHRAWWSRPERGAGWIAVPLVDIAIGLVASAATVAAVLRPFDVGVPFFSARWSLIDRLRYSADLYRKTTLNALNLWAVISAPHLQRATSAAPVDDRPFLLGVSYQYWGIGLSLAAALALALPLIRRGGAERLIWTSAAVTFAFFMLQTRIHERYFFPSITLMALAAALDRRRLWMYLAMSAIFSLNVFGVYERMASGPFAEATRSVGVIRGLALINCALLLVLIVEAVRDVRGKSATPAALAHERGERGNAPRPARPYRLEQADGS